MRYGITVTKKIGNAVVRNRMKRRFRELLWELLPTQGLPGHDHVLIGRDSGVERDFALAARGTGRRAGARGGRQRRSAAAAKIGSYAEAQRSRESQRRWTCAEAALTLLLAGLTNVGAIGGTCGTVASFSLCDLCVSAREQIMRNLRDPDETPAHPHRTRLATRPIAGAAAIVPLCPVVLAICD